MSYSGPAGVKKKKKFQKTSASEQRNDVENVDSAPNELKNPAKKVAKPVVSKASVQSTSVEMPPELCLELGFSAAVIRSAYWVPSIMHRIKTAVLASELRRSIHAPKIPVMEVAFLSSFFCFHWISANLKTNCTESGCQSVCRIRIFKSISGSCGSHPDELKALY